MDFLGIDRQSLVNLQLSLVFEELRGRFPWIPREAGDLQGIGDRFQENPMVVFIFYISLFSGNILEISGILFAVLTSKSYVAKSFAGHYQGVATVLAGREAMRSLQNVRHAFA